MTWQHFLYNSNDGDDTGNSIGFSFFNTQYKLNSTVAYVPKLMYCFMYWSHATQFKCFLKCNTLRRNRFFIKF